MMQKKYFFYYSINYLFAFILFSCPIKAQKLSNINQYEQQSYINIFDENIKKNEKIDLMFYVDSSKKADLATIQKQETQPKFKYIKSNTYVGFIKYPVWVKLNFRNITQAKRFFLETYGFNEIEFWQKNQQGIWQKSYTGEQLPFYTRPIVHRNFLFLLDGEPHKNQTIYIKYSTNTRIRFRMFVWEEAYFNVQNQNEILFYGFFYGIIVLMLVYNFLIWLRLRDIAYLFYVCFAASMFMLQFTSHGFAFQYLFPNSPFFNANGIYIWAGIVNISAGNFCRYFLDLPKKNPFWNKIVFFVSCYGFSVIILSFLLTFPGITQYVFILNPLYSLFLVAVGIIFWYKGNRYAPYFSMAWLAYLVGLVFSILYNWGFLSPTFLTGHTLQISTMVEIVMLSLAMSYKHKILDDEAKNTLLEIEKLRFEKVLQQQEKEFLEKSFIQKEKILQLEHERMEEMLAFKERELTITALQVVEKNNLIHEIQNKLQKIGKENENQDFKKIANILRNNVDLDNDWEKFKLHFEQVHPYFFQKLNEYYPALSQNDLKILAYLKINMGTKDIARLLNIAPKSLKMAKYRIKKKIGIIDDTDLQDFMKLFFDTQELQQHNP